VAISGRLARRLHETLGAEAGEDLVAWMQGVDTQRWEFRELHEATTARFEARVGEAEARLRGEILDLRNEVGVVRGEVAGIRAELQLGLSRLETLIERRYADLMRWSFVFWIGSVAAMTGAVAALDRFLR
jgi:hypothetical protein